MLANDSRTTRTSAPFQVGANLELLCHRLQATIRFLRVLTPASPTVFLTVHLPPLHRTGARAGNRGSRVPIPADPSTSGPVRLAPVYSPVAPSTTCIHFKEMQPATYLLVRAFQQLWLFETNEDCIDSSRRLCMRNLPSPHTARLLAVSIPSRSPG